MEYDLSDDPLESILAAILLGKSKQEYGELTTELNEYWDQVASEVEQIHKNGGGVAFPSEIRD